MQVITYQAPNGQTINLTEHHVAELERAGTWPKNARGEEYCRVSHGWHEGYPSYSGAEIARMVCEAVYYLPVVIVEAGDSWLAPVAELPEVNGVFAAELAASRAGYRVVRGHARIIADANERLVHAVTVEPLAVRQEGKA